MTVLGPWTEGFASWRRILGAVQEPEQQRAVFNNAVAEVAGFVAHGLDRAAAADELADMAASIGIDDADEIQAAIGTAFAQVNGPDRVPEDWIRDEPRSATPETVIRHRRRKRANT